jgi:hypothetical protein
MSPPLIRKLMLFVVIENYLHIYVLHNDEVFILNGLPPSCDEKISGFYPTWFSNLFRKEYNSHFLVPNTRF